MTLNKRNIITFTIGLIVISVCLSGCSAARHILARFQSTDHFQIYKNDERILFEPGAESFAEKVAEFLPSSIEKIEKFNNKSFQKPIKIYLCSTRGSYSKLSGSKTSTAVVSSEFFISPTLQQTPKRIPGILTHELTHLHLQQQIGIFKVSKLPSWFKEGIATLVAEGSGAETVTESEALHAINAGQKFTPNEMGSILFPKTANSFGLKPHMFYRQSMLFLSYLKNIDNIKFEEFLHSIQNGETFTKSFEQTYNSTVGVFWETFLAVSKTEAYQIINADGRYL
ncbi:MAG: hypothetical protein OQL18_10065 [Deltaproteobacteria bacterium]|nr:hypothetical protein [Deltaproteobacteria bacterium]